MSEITSPSALNSSQKFPSTAVVSIEMPHGRDSAKKTQATEIVIKKVTEGVTSAISSTSHETPTAHLKILWKVC